MALNGCRATLSTDLTGVNYTTPTAVPWDAESFDVGGWHDTVTNNTRLTVPSGVNYVIITGAVSAQAIVSGDSTQINIYKNGSVYLSGEGQDLTTAHGEIAMLGPVAVSPGDYFECYFAVDKDTSITILSTAGTSFCIYAVAP